MANWSGFDILAHVQNCNAVFSGTWGLMAGLSGFASHWSSLRVEAGYQ